MSMFRNSRHHRYLYLFLLSLAGCVKTPVFKDDQHALLVSNYPVVSYNNKETENIYMLDILEGETTVVIVYNTYTRDYRCTFSWRASAGIKYEVTDQSNRFPLTLYHWVRDNGVWAIRTDPVDPVKCTSDDKDAS